MIDLWRRSFLRDKEEGRKARSEPPHCVHEGYCRPSALDTVLLLWREATTKATPMKESI